MAAGIKFIIDFGGAKDEAPKREKGENLIALPENYTVIDTETTGLDPDYDEIIELAAVRVRSGTAVDEFDSLVKPKGYYFYENGKKYFNYVDDFITELTGITGDMLHNAPPIKDVLPGFVSFIADDIILGHNIHFDINFVYDAMEDLLNRKLSNDFVDLMRISRKVYPEFENHKLATIAEHLGIDAKGSHRALADCIITFGCFSKLSSHIAESDIDLQSLWKHSNKSTNLTTLKATTENIDIESPFYNKNCAFTGKLEKMKRDDAAQLVVNMGGKCANNVTKKTNFLVLGNFEYANNIKGEKSNKLMKAESLILKGQDLQIISENVFYDMISGS